MKIINNHAYSGSGSMGTVKIDFYPENLNAEWVELEKWHQNILQYFNGGQKIAIKSPHLSED